MKMKLRLMIYKWWRGHCRHLCRLCMYRDECYYEYLYWLLEEER